MVRGSVFDELEQRMNELRNELLGGRGGPTGGGFAEGVVAPEVDVQDDRDTYYVTADLPGVDKEDIDLQVDENGVRIRAEHKEETEEERAGYVHRERARRAFQRYVDLPEDVNPDGANARFKNGVLHLTLPKKNIEERRGRRIEIE